MSNKYFDNALDLFCMGDIDWINDEIMVSLIDTAIYTLDLVNHEYLIEIPTLAIAATKLISGRITNGIGVMDGDDTTLIAVPGDGLVPKDGLVIWKNLHNTAVSPLIAWIDQGDEFPYFPDGNDIPILWDDGADKILTLKNI